MANNTIQLNVADKAPFYERTGTEDILPGMLVKIVPGGVEKALLASEDVGPSFPLFAIENLKKGGTIYDSYLTNDIVYSRWMRSGDVVLAIIGLNQTIVYGDYLVGSYDAGEGGMLKKLVLGSNKLRCTAIAVEAITTTTTLGRIKVAIL